MTPIDDVDESDEDVRLAVYRVFTDAGRPPAPGELAKSLGVGEDEVRAGLWRLAEARHVVLGGDDAIVMAHPFSSVPLGFAVMGERSLWGL